jgi:hypothetical protein
MFTLALQRVLALPDAREILERGGGGTWTRGGCWILAQALCEHLGPPSASVQAIGDRVNFIGPEHWLVRVGDVVVDGDGAATVATLLRRWRGRQGIRKPVLLDVESSPEGISFPWRDVRALTSVLRQQLPGAVLHR